MSALRAQQRDRARCRPTGRPMVFAHGFGCDQNMWRFVAPAFEDRLPGRALRPRRRRAAPTSRPTTRERYASLAGLRRRRRWRSADELELRRRRLRRPLGQRDDRRARRRSRRPERFGALVLVGPSPRYIDDDGYVGGFSARGHRRAAGVAGQQLPRLVERDGAGDHGQPRPAGARRGADRTASAAPTRRSPRQLRARDVPLRQPRRPRRACATPTLVLQCSRRRDRPVAVGEYVHRAAPGSRARAARRDRATART